MKISLINRLHPLGIFIVALMLAAGCKKDGDSMGEVTDIDGNVYQTVKIGSQVWMAENLKTTRYRNGDPITYVTNYTWIDSTSGVYINYDYDPENGRIYGHLYNWMAVADDRKLAPKGWHIATHDDWNTLISHLDYPGQLKESGSAHWYYTDRNSTNSTGFTALPGGGYCHSYGLGTYDIFYITNIGVWWTSTMQDASNIYFTTMKRSWGEDQVYLGSISPTSCLSVRCVRD